jgi:predicted DNA binding CopG/RHH family protein
VIVDSLGSGYILLMQKAATAVKQVKSENQLLDQGISQLIQAVKQHASAKGTPLKREQLIKEGYSERFMAKVEKS